MSYEHEDLRTASFERFEVSMPLEIAMDCSAPGQDASEAVKHALNHESPWVRIHVSRELSSDDTIEGLIAEELKECGAWDEEQLKDHYENKLRLIWIAAGNIREEAGND